MNETPTLNYTGKIRYKASKQGWIVEQLDPDGKWQSIPEFKEEE